MPSRRKLILALASALATLLLAELAFRASAGWLGVDQDAVARFRALVASGGEAALYEPRPHVLYARRRATPGVNQLGFMDQEHAVTKAVGVTRVACLGSSTTEGGNPMGREGSYPFFLEDVLCDLSGRRFETLNFGMSGWTSAEIMIHYFLVVQDFAPDFVVLHFGANDVEPRSRDGYQPDYSHYRRPWRELRFSRPYVLLVRASDMFAASQLRQAAAFSLASRVNRGYERPYALPSGRPPPETSAAFRRNVRTILEHVTRNGGRAVLATLPFDSARAEPSTGAGIDEHNQILRELSEAPGTALADLAARHREAPDWLSAEFLDVVHVSPVANRHKAELIADAILHLEAMPERPPARRSH